MMLKVGVREIKERSYTFDTYPFKERHLFEFEWARRWAKNPGCDLLIHGMGGQGKTGLALGIARERMLAGDQILFQRLYQLRKENSASFSDRAGEASLLILDDMNLNLAGWREELLLGLFDLKKRVIITMAKTPEQAGLSERVIDRLRGFVRIHLS